MGHLKSESVAIKLLCQIIMGKHLNAYNNGTLVSNNANQRFFCHLVKIRGKFTEKCNILFIYLFIYINSGIFAPLFMNLHCNYQYKYG